MKVHPTKENRGQFYCNKCRVWKTNNKKDWYFNSNGKRDSMCKLCRKAYRKDAKKLYSRVYYSENRDHYLELSRKWREENIERKLWYSCRSNAMKRNLEFSITPEDIKIPAVCPVLGIPLDTYAESGVGSGHDWKKNPNRPSVDRIDNNKGYTKDNICVISWRANSLKKDADTREIELLYIWMMECCH